jgi:hypothetical protein
LNVPAGTFEERSLSLAFVQEQLGQLLGQLRHSQGGVEVTLVELSSCRWAGERAGETAGRLGQAGALFGSGGLIARARPAACQCLLLLPRTHFAPAAPAAPRSLFPAAARRTSGLCVARSAPALS